MNTNNRVFLGGISGAILALLIALPFITQALSIDAKTGADISASVGGSAGVSVTGASNSSASASSSSETGAGTEGSVSGEASAVLSTGLVRIVRADVEVGSASRVAPLSVRTDADLQAYVKGEIEADSGMQAVEISDSVSVDYAQRAKLFGFIPVTVTVTTEVDTDGKVSVRYPWYGFLLAKASGDADLKANIQSRVDSVRAGNVSAGAEAGAEFDANAKARLINEVRSALKSALEAQLQAESSASAGVTVN
jgi:hypothetical protein